MLIIHGKLQWLCGEIVTVHLYSEIDSGFIRCSRSMGDGAKRRYFPDTRERRRPVDLMRTQVTRHRFRIAIEIHKYLTPCCCSCATAISNKLEPKSITRGRGTATDSLYGKCLKPAPGWAIVIREEVILVTLSIHGIDIGITCT